MPTSTNKSSPNRGVDFQLAGRRARQFVTAEHHLERQLLSDEAVPEKSPGCSCHPENSQISGTRLDLLKERASDSPRQTSIGGRLVTDRLSIDDLRCSLSLDFLIVLFRPGL